MSLFGKLVKTAVNLAAIPVDVAKDILTLGGVSTKGEFKPYTQERIDKLVEDADDE